MIEMRKTPETGVKTPAKISVMQIDQDLKDGISKSEMAKKYNIKPWEVDEMFKHSFLKGRRPSRKKALSFTFVDDAPKTTPEEDFVDPNQVTLEQAIDNAMDSAEEARQELQDAEAAITEMLSPTQFATPEQEVVSALTDSAEEVEVEEITEELEEDDTTFEL
tara:strand:+ start:1173 stop:1661 length:489 start_codon:yes stop_codon:yes gene_type:complete